MGLGYLTRIEYWCTNYDNYETVKKKEFALNIDSRCTHIT